jgi:hypothetical protein
MDNGTRWILGNCKFAQPAARDWVLSNCGFARRLKVTASALARAFKTAMQLPGALIDAHGQPVGEDTLAYWANTVARATVAEFGGEGAFSEHQIEQMIGRMRDKQNLPPLPAGSPEKKQLILKVLDILEATRERHDPVVRRPAWASQ